MAKVDIRDRASLRQAYPPDAFGSDAARNEQVQSAILYGVRIGSAPDEDGRFELECASRHVGEPQTPHFLAPFQHADKMNAYDGFLDDIVAAAEQFGFRAEESPGRGDARIRGLRQ